MAITYTNANGVLYHLCKATTKTGKVRYSFAREACAEPVDEIPAGYVISESVNGVVSQARDRPGAILAEEVAAVEAAGRRHPKAGNYRVRRKQNLIEIYERVNPDAEALIDMLATFGLAAASKRAELEAILDRHARFAPVLRFRIEDRAQRRFRAERMCYLGSIDDFISLVETGTAAELARRLVPKLGTDDFYELW
jgi:hypothetical protein